MDVTYSEMHSVLRLRQLRPNRTIDKAQSMTACLIVFPALRQCMPAQKVTGLVFHISRAYWSMVRSAENGPMAAILCRVLSAQASGLR